MKCQCCPCFYPGYGKRAKVYFWGCRPGTDGSREFEDQVGIASGFTGFDRLQGYEILIIVTLPLMLADASVANSNCNLTLRL